MILSNLGVNTVFHYTNFTALENILRTRSIWLSHSSSLNDLSEGLHGVKILCDAMKLSRTNNDDLNSIDNFQGVMEYATKKEGFYVASFCQEGNSLVQWRAYANDGCGVAIGFDVDKLKSICEDYRYAFGKCGYSESENKNIFEDIYGNLSNISPKNDVNFPVILVAMTSAFIKHSGFSCEKEYRIVSGPGVENKDRKRNDKTINYHSLDLSDNFSWLKEIYVGPCKQQLSIGSDIQALLEELRIDVTNKIRYSDIPYRGIRNY